MDFIHNITKNTEQLGIIKMRNVRRNEKKGRTIKKLFVSYFINWRIDILKWENKSLNT